MSADPATAIPLFRRCPFAPPPEHVALRDEQPRISPVELPTGNRAWAITRHEDVRALLADTRFRFSKDHPGFTIPDMSEFGGFPLKAPVITELPPAEHQKARRSLLSDFTVRKVAELEPRIQQIVEENIDAMLAGPGPVDLVQVFSLPLPSLVICELLGVPYADHEFFQERSAQGLDQAATARKRAAGIVELINYLDALVREKEQNPGDDLLSRQILKRDDGGPFDHDSLLSLAFALLTAGHETTASMISLGALTLLQHPEQLADLKENPDKMPAAVEELLRFYTIAESVNARYATEDAEFCGIPIAQGEWIIPLTNTANRDPEVFDHPDRFDIERGGRQHLAFGFGAHQCMGQNLARLELRVALETLFRRIPDLRLAVSLDEVPFRDTDMVYGIRSLPVTW